MTSSRRRPVRDLIAHDRRPSEQGEHEAADAVHLPVSERAVEVLTQFVEPERAGDPQGSVRERHDGGRLRGSTPSSMSPTTSWNRSSRVKQAGGAAALVDHDGHVRLLALERGEHVIEGGRLGNDGHRGRVASPDWPAGDQAAEHVLHVDESEHVVEIAVEHGIPGVRRRRDGRPDVAWRGAGRDPNDAHPRASSPVRP